MTALYKKNATFCKGAFCPYSFLVRFRFEYPFREGTEAVYEEDEDVRDMGGGPPTPFLFLTELGSAATPMAWADRKSLVASPSISADVSLMTVTHV